jgi:hypothetical protein
MAMIERKDWKEFQDSKLLWWINRILHTFGWAIVLETLPNGQILDAYPARVSFRGFSEQDEEDGFNGLADWMRRDRGTAP